MTFSGWFMVMIVLRLWAFLEEKYANEFTRLEVDPKMNSYEFPVYEDFGKAMLSASPDPLHQAGLETEQINMMPMSFVIPIEHVTAGVWEYEIWKMRVGVGHLSKLVLYTEPELLMTSFMYVGDLDQTKHMLEYDIFDPQKKRWVWEEK